MFSVLHHDYFRTGVNSLVHARIGLVCNIDAWGDTTVHDTSHKGYSPLRGVEAHNSNGWMVSYTQLMTRFREKHWVLIILVPGPAKLYSIAFNPHRWSVLAATNGVLEHLIEGEGDLRARTTLTHLYRKLIVNVCCPVEALSVLWIDQAFIAIRRHHNNSVVAHSQVLNKKIYFDWLDFVKRVL